MAMVAGVSLLQADEVSISIKSPSSPMLLPCCFHGCVGRMVLPPSIVNQGRSTLSNNSKNSGVKVWTAVLSRASSTLKCAGRLPVSASPVRGGRWTSFGAGSSVASGGSVISVPGFPRRATAVQLGNPAPTVAASADSASTSSGAGRGVASGGGVTSAPGFPGRATAIQLGTPAPTVTATTDSVSAGDAPSRPRKLDWAPRQTTRTGYCELLVQDDIPGETATADSCKCSCMRSHKLFVAQ